MKFYLKYIKYKNKYLNLKNLYGGSSSVKKEPDVIENDDEPRSNIELLQMVKIQIDSTIGGLPAYLMPNRLEEYEKKILREMNYVIIQRVKSTKEQRKFKSILKERVINILRPLHEMKSYDEQLESIKTFFDGVVTPKDHNSWILWIVYGFICQMIREDLYMKYVHHTYSSEFRDIIPMISKNLEANDIQYREFILLCKKIREMNRDVIDKRFVISDSKLEIYQQHLAKLKANLDQLTENNEFYTKMLLYAKSYFPVEKILEKMKSHYDMFSQKMKKLLGKSPDGAWKVARADLEQKIQVKIDEYRTVETFFAYSYKLRIMGRQVLSEGELLKDEIKNQKAQIQELSEEQERLVVQIREEQERSGSKKKIIDQVEEEDTDENSVLKGLMAQAEKVKREEEKIRLEKEAKIKQHEEEKRAAQAIEEAKTEARLDTHYDEGFLIKIFAGGNYGILIFFDNIHFTAIYKDGKLKEFHYTFEDRDEETGKRRIYFDEFIPDSPKKYKSGGHIDSGDDIDSGDNDTVNKIYPILVHRLKLIKQNYRGNHYTQTVLNDEIFT